MNRPQPFAAPIARHGRNTPLTRALIEDAKAFMRAGYYEVEECRNVMLEAFAREYGLTFRQAERIFNLSVQQPNMLLNIA